MIEQAQASSSLAQAALEYPSTSVSGRIETKHGDAALIKYAELDEREAIRFVSDNGSGATVLFSGTTRDSFKGKKVTKLEYEAYTSLALSTLQQLLAKSHTSAPFTDTPVARSANAAPFSQVSSSQGNQDRVTRCYVAHRLGEVKVGECSILIAVSSPHRKEAFVVAEWLLEEVKKNVAIWKREFYATGESLTALDGQSTPVDSQHQAAAESGARLAEVDGGDATWSWKANFTST
ncbi:related to molybdopterin synthase large subunit [Melanopsichium pennsylvanicum]|uniref:Related to molybdopterin synthase large subunit n=2 Tax=Melanopsichium pennsylvanicum TaxID=63383 RepID=A0AAJ5C428_9BASI|nr:related to molybdopterin synthase large subunit [Melanopsichium pennsylvanicum 4]SNX83069.1 related to molybdopterin synthase large subunit [Melanopsichium pennsylvanicum]